MSPNHVVLRPVTGPEAYPALVDVWEGAVVATHHFLTPADIARYREQLPTAWFPQVELTVATLDDVPVGFAGTAGNRLEMLFVAAERRGAGIGSTLLRAALDARPDLELDVNEQNPEALGFYLHHGLVETGRSPLDGEGRPFPLVHLAVPRA